MKKSHFVAQRELVVAVARIPYCRCTAVPCLSPLRAGACLRRQESEGTLHCESARIGAQCEELRIGIVSLLQLVTTHFASFRQFYMGSLIRDDPGGTKKTHFE